MAGKIESSYSQLDKLERQTRQLMKRIHSLSLDEYFQAPYPGSWSVGQVANHLLLSERLSFAYVKKKTSYPDTLPPYHIKSWGSVIALKWVLQSPLKRKAPTAINMWEDQVVLPPDELESNWKSQRAQLREFLAQHHEAFGSHLVYRHPFAGRMTMRQMLIFFNDHMTHHIKQVDRIIQKLHSGR